MPSRLDFLRDSASGKRFHMFERIVLRIHKKLVGLVEIKGIILSAKPYVEQIQRFRKTPNVKALLVRVDSPGGGVAPAQEIHEAIQRTRQTKPVIASMGSIAASGGYYIASAAEKVFANPGTLTGSIGVAMHMRNLQDLMSRIGVDNAVIKSGTFKDAGSPYRRMTPKEERYLQEVSDEIYDQFIEAVSKSRSMEQEEVEKIADGRIYTGKRAQELGLVDAIGGLEEAGREAGRMVGIMEEPHIVSFRKKRRMFSRYLMQAAVRQLLSEWELETASAQGFLLLAPIRGA
jgi:protease-4